MSSSLLRYFTVRSKTAALTTASTTSVLTVHQHCSTSGITLSTVSTTTTDAVDSTNFLLAAPEISSPIVSCVSSIVSPITSPAQLSSTSESNASLSACAITSTSKKRLVPDNPHQPQNFKFPKRKFGQTTIVERSFQASWFDLWPWLHYDEQQDAVFCHICLKAKEEKKIVWSHNAEAAFLTKGFTNWKDARAKFDKHNLSSCHKEAHLKVVELPVATKDIGESLSNQLHRDRLERRHCFLKLVSNCRFLARPRPPFTWP